MTNLTEYSAVNALKRQAMIAQLLKRQGFNLPKAQIIARKGEQEAFPLSFSQQRLWFLSQLLPDSAAYNVPLFRRLIGSLNREVLNETLNEIARRHETLRTSFTTREAQPVQVVQAFTPSQLLLDDLREVTEAERSAQLSRIISGELGRPFNLMQAPLWRARLVQLGEEEHVLLLVMHHIIFDGWSYGVFCRELASIYPAFLRDQPSPLPALPLQYTDFALWQREWLQGDVLKSQLGYWRRQLAGATPVIELPADHTRPVVQGDEGGSQAFILSESLTEHLRALSKAEGVSLYMFLLAAFKVLLHRYTGQEEIVVGSPIANRTRADFDGVIGCFINMLVLNTTFEGEPSFRGVLRRVREIALAAYAHQDMPFEKLVEELQPKRDLSHHPLVQVVFALQTAHPATLEFGGLTMTPLPSVITSATFDLALSLIDRPEALAGTWIYNQDLFEAASIKRLSEHFRTLLESVVADPQQRISRLPLLSPAERQHQLVGWNQTQREYPSHQCLHQLFEFQVEQTPDAVAVTYEETQLTYAELNARSNQLAHHLRRVGVGPEVLVGLCVGRSIEMIVGLLGILKAGGAYLPLDPTYPAERLSVMLNDAAPRVLITEEHLLSVLPDHCADVLCLDRDWPLVSTQPIDNFSSGGAPDNMAYVIYTSGSTGRPRGVQIIHRAVVNFLSAMRVFPGFQKTDTLAAITTLCFDIAVLELFLPLVNGARVVVVDREEAADGHLLAKRLLLSGVTVLQATPSSWRMLLRSEWKPSPQSKLFCGGEALDAELAEQLTANGARLWNLYGPTETTIWSSAADVTAADEVTSIGTPIANTQIYVLDKCLEPVPVGVAGDLYVAGAGLARGYLNAPDLTAQTFIANPYSEQAGARMYRTGDLASYSAQGKLRFIGRADHQVKMRGYRIEPGEIEARLSEYSAVAQSVVMLREDSAGDKRLTAYVVASDGFTPSVSELRLFLHERLPEYMVPSFFVMLESLPLTRNGKVNRGALPAPDLRLLDKASDFVAPRTPVEKTLAGIWANVLGLESVSARSNFFDLGGHSLLAIQLISRIRQTFQVEMPLRRLFETPTISQTAAAIEQYQAAQGEGKALEKMLLRVEQLSDDEVTELLSSKLALI
jgi:amino acid adenylation domain-containing protein